MLLPVLSLILLPLAAIIYRSGSFAYHNVLTLPSLPSLYVHPAFSSSGCTNVHSDAPDNGTAFCEDAVFWDTHHPSSGALLKRLVVMSCDPNRHAWNTVMGPLDDPNPRGALWVYDPDSSSPSARPQPIELRGYPPAHDFHPLGIAVHPGKDKSTTFMYVINHARSHSTIEQFALSPSHPALATYVRTLSHPLFVAPNSLALTSPTSFYLSNDHLFTRRLPLLGHFLPLIESLLALPLSWIAHVTLDPATGAITRHRIASWGIAFPNGVSLSASGAELALASSSLGLVRFFSRNPDTNRLVHAGDVRVPFAPDNVAHADDGSLVVAGHPHFPSLVAVSKGKAEHSPSWVVRLTPRPLPSSSSSSSSSKSEMNKTFDPHPPLPASLLVPASPSHVLETLFQSDGSSSGGFSSSSSALVDERGGAGRARLFVSGLYARGLEVCG